ncbi:hypothetical protein XELAEV_18030526mg [Xenopus laevis]|uniref:Uncharacterized protein n=1 Tax=Xenopus laevis TaxID=8355 RepID=A0A974HF56_XENLA|nr:hypothetical protein XELAEV_18030526mg [Xenopus laevis]
MFCRSHMAVRIINLRKGRWSINPRLLLHERLAQSQAQRLWVKGVKVEQTTRSQQFMKEEEEAIVLPITSRGLKINRAAPSCSI